MKLKNLFFSAFLLMIAQLTVFGQSDFGFKVNMAAGFTPYDGIQSGDGINEKKYFAPSGQIGIFYSYNFGKNSLVGADVLFNQVESRESSDLPQLSVYTEYQMHLSYLSLPVYYGFNYNHFSLHIGLQTSLYLGGSDKLTTGMLGADRGPAYSNGNTKLRYVDHLNFGPKLGMTYSLSTDLALEITYYHGIKNNSQSPSAIEQNEWRIRQYTLGIRYNFTD